MPRRRKIEHLLRGLGLLPEGSLVNAAVALFGKSDRLKAYYPQLEIRLGRFRGVDRLADFADNRQYWGHAFDLLHRAETFLMDHVPIAGRVVSGKMRREDRPAYPPRATREALANALCHRDYSEHGGAVTVALYDDHLEIANPNGFHHGMTPEKLIQPHESKPWNPIIADVFYRTEVTEKFGMGALNIVDWCRRNGNPPPAWEERGGSVVIAFKPAAPLPESQPDSRLKSRLESQLKSRLESGNAPLPERVLEILVGGALMKSEISERLGQKRVSGQLHRVIRDLLAAGKIERTIPDKPGSRLQRYRLIE